MRAWDETEEVLRRQAERRAETQAETLDELAEHGVDLDPETRRGAGGEPVEERDDAPGGAGAHSTHRHGDLEHASDHVHPHAHSGPGQKPVVGVVGAGAVGTALGVALSKAGWPVGAVASRDPRRRSRFGELVPGVRAFAEPNALVDDVELVLLAVPDDVVEPLARSLRLYAGQAIVHTSGLLGAEVLEPAMAAGTQAGAFHPLVAFADLDRAL
ncbi:MAG: NAD(P)-binding domain-containing protein, partial [Chloroflexota bacterium]